MFLCSLVSDIDSRKSDAARLDVDSIGRVSPITSGSAEWLCCSILVQELAAWLVGLCLCFANTSSILDNAIKQPLDGCRKLMMEAGSLGVDKFASKKFIKHKVSHTPFFVEVATGLEYRDGL